MSKKNSNAILKSIFKNLDTPSKIYFDFKTKLNKSRNKSFVIAVSGGPDSLALTALSKAYGYEKKKKFYYVLINHKLRKNSSKEALQVKKLLKKYQIYLNILTNLKPIKKNIQSEARKLRYELLAKFCKEKNVKTILTAHNLEDQVETFFIRLSRGSGLTGLSAMKPSSEINKKLKLFRPLLNIQKKDLIQISKKVFGKYFKDPSNKNEKYLRTKIRNLKEPLIKSGISYDQIIKSINNLASSKDTLDYYYKKSFKELVEKTKDKITLNLNIFQDLKKEIKIRAINDSIRLLKNNYYNIRSKKVENLVNQLKGKNFKKSTLGGCIFYVKEDKLCLKIEN